MLRVRPTNFDNPMVLMLWSSVHSIGSQMHNRRVDLLFPTHATRVLREWGAASPHGSRFFRLAKERLAIKNAGSALAMGRRTQNCDGAVCHPVRGSFPLAHLAAEFDALGSSGCQAGLDPVPNQVARFRTYRGANRSLFMASPARAPSAAAIMASCTSLETSPAT